MNQPGGNRGQWIPWAGAPENYQISLAALVANGTMSADIAATLWAAADAGVSFITVAVPRNAGKTTVASAMLALRRPGVPLHFALGEPEELEQLRKEKLGGYLVIGEFSQASMPSYIWGESVRQVFATLRHGYALQTSLHAPGVDAAVQAITRGNQVSDADAGLIDLVIYIEVRQTAQGESVRRVVDVYELDAVTNGSAAGRSLHRWLSDADNFEKLEQPRSFATDPMVLDRRRLALQQLVDSGRTSVEDVAEMAAQFAG